MFYRKSTEKLLWNWWSGPLCTIPTRRKVVYRENIKKNCKASLAVSTKSWILIPIQYWKRSFKTRPASVCNNMCPADLAYFCTRNSCSQFHGVCCGDCFVAYSECSCRSCFYFHVLNLSFFLLCRFVHHNPCFFHILWKFAFLWFFTSCAIWLCVNECCISWAFFALCVCLLSPFACVWYRFVWTLFSGESRIIFLPERSSICQYPPKISAINKQSRACK